MSQPDFRDPGVQREAERAATHDEAVTGAETGPVDDLEGRAAADGLTSSPEVAEHYREMTDTGTSGQGEGRIS